MDKRIIEETPSTELLNDDWFIKDSPTGGTSKILGSNLKDIISGDVENAIDKILSSIATEWRANASYSNGTYVMYEGELYECFVNGSTVGQFKKNTEWLHRTVNSMVKDVIRMIAQRFYASTVSPPSLTPYSKGDLVWYSQPYHEDELYICKQDLPNGDTEWVPEHWDKVTDISGLSKYLMDKIAEAGQIDDVTVADASLVDENKVAKLDRLAIIRDMPSGAISTFKDGSGLPLSSLTVSIEPQQDLHGYDNPWVGGAGKNKLPLTVDDIKNANPSIAWSGNEATKSGVTFKIETDNNGNVSGIKLNGTATDDIQFLLGIGITFNGDYILNGGLSVSISVAVQGKVLSAGADRAFTDDGTTSRTSWIFVENGTVCNNVVKPMVRLASVVDSTFAPYSNICPISGWAEEVITVADDTTTPTVEQTYTIPFVDGQGQSVEVFGGECDVVNGGEQPRTLGSVDLGTLNWIKGNMNTAGTGRIFYVPLTASSPMKQPSNNGFCEALKYNPFSNWPAGQWERQILNGITVTNSSALVACVPDIYSSASDFKTAMNGVKFVYELATPTTFYTHPTSINSLDGENNVFADCGDVVSGEYIADASLVIADLDARITALENA